MRADQKCGQKCQLFHQLTRTIRDWGSLRHGNRLDALPMAVGYWSEYHNRDIFREEEARMEELMEIEYPVRGDGVRT
jgi:hypothetical protein